MQRLRQFGMLALATIICLAAAAPLWVCVIPNTATSVSHACCPQKVSIRDGSVGVKSCCAAPQPDNSSDVVKVVRTLPDSVTFAPVVALTANVSTTVTNDLHFESPPLEFASNFSVLRI